MLIDRYCCKGVIFIIVFVDDNWGGYVVYGGLFFLKKKGLLVLDVWKFLIIIDCYKEL